MTSSASKNRLRLAAEIQRSGRPSEIPCDRCFFTGHDCVVMEGASRLRCSECVRLGRACVNLTWASLDRTREEYQKKVDDDEDELCRLLARLMRNKKILRQAETRAKKKAVCLANELEASNELEPNEDCPAADATVGLSPAVWSTLDFVNNSVGLYSAEVASSSSGAGVGTAPTASG